MYLIDESKEKKQQQQQLWGNKRGSIYGYVVGLRLKELKQKTEKEKERSQGEK